MKTLRVPLEAFHVRALVLSKPQDVPEPLHSMVSDCAVCGKPCEFAGWDVCTACQSQRHPHSMALKPAPNVSHRRNIPYAVWAAAFCLFCTVMGLLWKWGVL